MNGRVNYKIVFLALFTGFASSLVGQRGNDSLLSITSVASKKFIGQVTEKTEKYYERITDKTEKALMKLARWEGKIKTILEKTSPETAQQLFANGQLTFSDVLNKYKERVQIADDQRARYDEYRDRLTTTVKYLDEKRALLDSSLLNPLKDAKDKTAMLNEQLKKTEEVQQFIKERKRELLEQAVKHLGKSKYLQKINKEAYYYAETLRNYKEIFSDPKKAEETALKLLQKIPAFNEFLRKNSMLAAMFGLTDSSPFGGGQEGALSGLQTRAQVNSLTQQQIAAGGPNAQAQFQQNVQEAQSQLRDLKDKVIKAGGDNSDAELPDFKPNSQKSKTFKQRLEYSANFQTQRATGFFPVTSDAGLSVGYKISDKSVIGLGASYKLGWGRGWDHIKITHQGVGLRSYVDIKLKGSFWISGGYEQSYRPLNEMLLTLPLSGGVGGGPELWQKGGLLGVSKIISLRSPKGGAGGGFFKKTKASLLWDFLSYRQVPRGQAVVFRISYNMK